MTGLAARQGIDAGRYGDFFWKTVASISKTTMEPQNSRIGTDQETRADSEKFHVCCIQPLIQTVDRAKK